MNPRARRLRRLRRKSRIDQAEHERAALERHRALVDRLQRQAERKQNRLVPPTPAVVSGGARLAAMLSGIPKP